MKPQGTGKGHARSLERCSHNWLPSRFGLLIETRRRYGCLRMVFSGVRLFRAPIWCPSGGWRHARGREHCESLVVLYRVGTHQIRRRRRAARSLTSQGRAEPLCARIKGASREGSEGKLMSDHCHFSSYEGHKERRTGKICGAFNNAQGFGRLDAGSRAGFTSSRPPPPWTSVFQFFIFLYDVWP